METSWIPKLRAYGISCVRTWRRDSMWNPCGFHGNHVDSNGVPTWEWEVVETRKPEKITSVSNWAPDFVNTAAVCQTITLYSIQYRNSHSYSFAILFLKTSSITIIRFVGLKYLNLAKKKKKETSNSAFLALFFSPIICSRAFSLLFFPRNFSILTALSSSVPVKIQNHVFAGEQDGTRLRTRKM